MKKQLLLILMTLLPHVANAYDAKINGIYYNFSGNEAIVTFQKYQSSSPYYISDYSGSIVIPEIVTYNGTTYSVTNIENYAFYGCSSLTSVTIPSSVTNIENYAFSGCTGLTSITIPNSVTVIGDYAFRNCTSLTSVTIPTSVTSIGNRAFEYCTSLTSITIPNSVTSIGSHVFNGTGWYNAQPDGILYLDNWLIDYKGNEPTGNLTIKSGTRGIAKSSFSECTGLTSVTIPSSVTSIGDHAFSYCSGLTSVTIGSGVTSIGECAFENCTSLTSVTIPNSVTSIGVGAFLECKCLTSVTIGNGVAKISILAFAFCPRLRDVYCYAVNVPVASAAFQDSNISSATLHVPSRSINSYKTTSPWSEFKNIVAIIENTVINRIYYSLDIDMSTATVIRNPYGYSGFVIIPESVSYKNETYKVTSIDDKAFSGCSGLTSVTIPNSVTGIGDKAFSDCYGLKSVTIGSGVLSIRDNSFYNSFPKIVIWLTNTPPTGYQNVKGTINYVSNNNFSGLSNIKVYPFLSSMFEVDGIKYAPVSPSERTCDAIDCSFNELAESINIGESVTYKGIEMTVKQIQPYLFYGNEFIKNVSLYSTITSIGDGAFGECSKLNSIAIPNSVTSIGNGAFLNCSSIPTIQIPQSVISIGDNVFSGCTTLKTVLMDNGDTELSLGSNDNSPLFASCPLDSVYIGRNITYPTASNKGYSPFYRNTTLRSVTITDKETEISENEFYGCKNLKNVRIGDGVTTIGNYAFSGCSSLESFAFGSNVGTIGKEAFSDCTAMASINSKATTPPTCGTQALDDINKWECTLTVPEGYLTAYQQADQWKEFFFINEGNGDDNPIIPDPKKCATPTISYTNGELKFNCETEEVQFYSKIKDDDIKSYNSDKIELGVTYTITVYATKAGYEDSDVATATLCWIDVEPATEGIIDEDAVNEVKALPVLIQTQGGIISIQGTAEGTPIAIYGVDGREYGSADAVKDRTTIATSLQPGSVAVVKIGEKAVKVLVK